MLLINTTESCDVRSRQHYSWVAFARNSITVTCSASKPAAVSSSSSDPSQGSFLTLKVTQHSQRRRRRTGPELLEFARNLRSTLIDNFLEMQPGGSRLHFPMVGLNWRRYHVP